MKLRIAIIALFLFSLTCSKNSYVGEYYTLDDPKIGLELRDDGTCILFDAERKERPGQVGKYKIEGNRILIEIDTGFEGIKAVKGEINNNEISISFGRGVKKFVKS